MGNGLGVCNCPMLNDNYANSGKSLEYLIYVANQQYLAKRVALVQYIPTDWTVISRGTQIISAFSAHKSTMEYIGVRTPWAKGRRSESFVVLGNLDGGSVERNIRSPAMLGFSAF